VPTLIGDKTVGLTMVYAVMAALIQRERTGAGQAIEVPMLETMTAFVMTEHMGGLTFDPPRGEPGYSRMLAPDRRPHPTADGHICILPYTDRHWRDFFRIAGRPELADDPRLADAQTRSRHVAELYALIAECVRDGSTASWLEKLKSADIPSGPVNPLGGLPADEHLAAVKMFPQTDHPTEGSIRIVGRQYGLARRTARCAVRRRGWASIRARSCAKPGSPTTKSRICSPARSQSKRSNCDRISEAIRGERDGPRSFQQRPPLQASRR
jgi:crotonobetainyl-CoA:carnitine CoA-transferase CaiB-like acyl-CoA transferase